MVPGDGTEILSRGTDLDALIVAAAKNRVHDECKRQENQGSE